MSRSGHDPSVLPSCTLWTPVASVCQVLPVMPSASRADMTYTYVHSNARTRTSSSAVITKATTQTPARHTPITRCPDEKASMAPHVAVNTTDRCSTNTQMGVGFPRLLLPLLMPCSPCLAMTDYLTQ